MVKRRLLVVLSFAVLCLSAAPAMADFIAPTGPVTFGPGSPGESSLQDVLDNITVNPDPPHTDPGDPGSGVWDSSVITTTDAILDSWDSLWMIGGATGQSATTLVIEIAGYAPINTFGIYDATDPTKMVNVFLGGASAGDRTVVSILLDGSVEVGLADSGIDFAGNLFGFYLATPDGTFYSDTALNTVDNVDHMLAYQGKGTDWVQVGVTQPGLWQTDTYALAWEDLLRGGDGDYQDFVAMIESVTPVPVPTAVLLGVIGLGIVGLKLRKYA